MEPANSRSPENMISSSGSRKLTDPLVWPGVWSTTSSSPASGSTAPSDSSRTSSGSLSVSPPNSDALVSDQPAAGSLSRWRSSGWIHAGTSRAPHTGATDQTWSR